MQLESEKIYPPYIYSIKYNGEEDNEYNRLFNLWNDVDYLVKFMSENKSLLLNSVWPEQFSPEDAARRVLDEAFVLENLFSLLNENTKNGEKPDFNTHFKYLDGKYNYELEYVPMKSYSKGHPAMLRWYAIKMKSNFYLITGGGIKLADKIQNSPDLKNHVLQNIEKVRVWLKENGIFYPKDLDH